MSVTSAGSMRAQSAMVTGVVHPFGDSVRVLRDVELRLDPPHRTARSDATGHFVFSALASGAYTLTAQRIGFEPATLPVVVDSTGSVVLSVALRATAQTLRTITVAGHVVSYPARYAEAYARIARENGKFYTRESIDSLNPMDVKSLLQTVPTVQVNDRGITFARCQGGLMGSMPTGSLSQTSSVLTGGEGAGPNAAHVQVYVDGVRRTNYSVSPEFQVDAEHALRGILPTSIQLLEVYSGVSRIPGEYLNDACAVILIWTRSY